MAYHKEEVQALFNRFYNKTATKEEVDRLFTLLQNENDDEFLSELMLQHWDATGSEPLFDADKSMSILTNILSQNKPEARVVKFQDYFTWKKLAIAASFIAIVSYGGYKLSDNANNIPKGNAVTKVPAKDIKPGGNKATLTLADGSVIALDDAKEGTVINQGNIEITKSKNGQLTYSVNPGASAGEISINTLTTPRGGQYEVVLPDGTRVWLNAASSLKFPTAFTGKDRNVELSGEAYFEVAKNKNKPFKVVANQTTVTVLGTHFNIMSYTDEPKVAATLLEGSVSFSKGSSNVLLKPGQQASAAANSTGIKLFNVDVDEVVAWKQGDFVFQGENIQEIMRKVSRWYDVEVVYQGDLSGQDFSGEISKFNSLSKVLSMLEKTGTVHFKVEGRRVIVMQN